MWKEIRRQRCKGYLSHAWKERRVSFEVMKNVNATDVLIGTNFFNTKPSWLDNLDTIA